MILLKTHFSDYHEVTKEQALNIYGNFIKSAVNITKDKDKYFNEHYLKGITIEVIKNDK